MISKGSCLADSSRDGHAGQREQQTQRLRGKSEVGLCVIETDRVSVARAQ